LRKCRAGLFPLGARGAGRFVHCGSYFGEEFMERTGQGAAFGQHGSARVAVFTVVNARGVIIDRTGKVVRGNRDPSSGRRASIQERIVSPRYETASGPTPPGLTDNTTLTLVVTNLALNREQLERLGIETHSSMARAIQPFHTIRDGDTLFAISTGDCVAGTPNVADLSVIASELAWDAVLSCLPRDADVPSTDPGSSGSGSGAPGTASSRAGP
jgi:L-aminopeptidase/D-esterase-like protein